jgi:MoaA/NifB/PqqE/SkfB family radical SAM enzyme
MSFNGLFVVNIEMTSLCNKNCWMCGRRKIDRDYPELAIKYGHMDFSLLESIAAQLPKDIVVQFHNNGEPLMYPRFGDAVALFKNQIRCTDTNGKLLVEKSAEIIENLDTITISTFESDTEANQQLGILKEFLKIKGDRKPSVVIRCLGDIEAGRREEYKKLNCIIADRVLHSPMGSFKYEKKTTVPEIGICLEILSHVAINVMGEVSICVRFDPKRLGVIGDLRKESLSDIWNGEKRKAWVKAHVAGKRSESPLCKACEFWGIPRG